MGHVQKLATLEMHVHVRPEKRTDFSPRTEKQSQLPGSMPWVYPGCQAARN